MIPKFLVVCFSLFFAAFASGVDKKTSHKHTSKQKVQEKKENFTELLLPVIEEENKAIAKDRELVLAFFKEFPQERIELQITKQKLDPLMATARKYKVSDMFDKQEYLKKIDSIPTSLVLSQAALESGWGTSRLTKNANNFFGQKSFISGRKTVTSIDGNDKYSAFANASEAVRSYMLNLNSHEAYREFRNARAGAKEKNIAFSGLKAARSLKNYSEAGREYTKMVAEMINKHFISFDEKRNITLAQTQLSFIAQAR